MSIFRTIVVAALLAFVNEVVAGPGANTYACINLVAKSGNNFTVNFDPNNGQNKCMLQSGSKNSVLVTGSSSTCVSIGYVEAKVSSSGGDLCATDESIWNIGYATSGLPNEKSGNIKSRWRKQWGSQTNEISFYNNPPGAQVCGSPNLCYSTLYTWDTGSQPNVYFIFRPDQQNSLSEQQVSENPDQIAMVVEDEL